MTQTVAKSTNQNQRPIGTFHITAKQGKGVFGVIMERESDNELELHPDRSMSMPKTQMQDVARRVNCGHHKRKVVLRTMGSDNECRAYLKPKNGTNILTYIHEMNDIMSITLIE